MEPELLVEDVMEGVPAVVTELFGVAISDIVGVTEGRREGVAVIDTGERVGESVPCVSLPPV
jgi:antitoxin (DNA-binding transcriptional repressor) of toxin-antitoxin stability system